VPDELRRDHAARASIEFHLEITGLEREDRLSTVVDYLDVDDQQLDAGADRLPRRLLRGEKEQQGRGSQYLHAWADSSTE
jgi:hypothetical protein